MAEVSTAIWMALKQRIDPIQGWPIAWPASMFEPDGKTRYLAVAFTTAPPGRLMIGSNRQHERNGTLSIGVVMPLGQPAVQIYQNEAAKIAAHFPEDLRLTYQDVTVRINNAPHVADGYRDNGYWRIPVNVPFTAYA